MINNLITGISGLFKRRVTDTVDLLNGKFKYIQNIVIYRLVLDFIYLVFVSNVFNVTGFDFNFNILNYALSWVILLIFLPMIINICYKDNLSNIVLNILIFISFMPLVSMIAYFDFNYMFILQILIYWFVLLKLFIIVPDFKIKRVSNIFLDKLLLYGIIGALSAVILYISWRYTGFRITLDIFNVYSIRTEAANYTMPTVLEYIFAATKIINPLLLVYYLSEKKYFFATIIFALQILSFSINGIKMVLFGTIIAIILYYFYRENYLKKLPVYLYLLGLAGLLEYYILSSYSILTLFFRRVLFLPNLIHYYFFDFFTKHRPDFYFQGPMKYLGFESLYPKLSNLIASIYFLKPDMAANNGLFSDAFANFGVFGIILMPIMIVLILKLLDACSRDLNKKIFLPFGLTLAIILISSFFVTILITHGLLLACIVLYLLPRNNEKLQNSLIGK